MALNYSFIKYKDSYIITNNESLVLGYTLTRETCDTSVTIKTGTIAVGQTAILDIKVDGNYEFTPYTENENGIPVIIKNYNNLLLSLIEGTEKIICGCSKCNDCEECSVCEDYLSLFMKDIAFSTLNTPLYKTYIDKIEEETICDFTDNITCALLKEKAYGNAPVKEVMIRILSYYYLAFYYKDLFLGVDAEEKEYITKKYKYVKINQCMRNLQVSSYEVITSLEQGSKVYFWQQDSPLLTLNTEALLINEGYLASKPNLPYETFENGYKVTYELNDKIVFYIGPTQVEDFVIYDSLGNDITDEFDSQYIESTGGYLLVSKVPYSASQIYFKFKKQI